MFPLLKGLYRQDLRKMVYYNKYGTLPQRLLRLQKYDMGFVLLGPWQEKCNYISKNLPHYTRRMIVVGSSNIRLKKEKMV